jgi:hypothetical protein
MIARSSPASPTPTRPGRCRRPDPGLASASLLRLPRVRCARTPLPPRGTTRTGPPPPTSPPSFPSSPLGLTPSAARAHPFFQGRRARLFRTVRHRHAHATAAPPLFVCSVALSCGSESCPGATSSTHRRLLTLSHRARPRPRTRGHEPDRRPAESPAPAAGRHHLGQPRLLHCPFPRAPPPPRLLTELPSVSRPPSSHRRSVPSRSPPPPPSTEIASFVKHHRAGRPSPPPRRVVPSVGLRRHLLARRLRPSPLVLTASTEPPPDHRRTAGELTTARPSAQ